MTKDSCILFVGKKFTKRGTLYKKLGDGGTSIVNVYMNNNTKFVVKELLDKWEDTRVFVNEFEIGKNLEHENVMKIFDIDVTARYLLLEYYEGIDLFSFLELTSSEDINSNINLKFKLDCFQQLLCGVEYMHNNMIAHMDLKLENIIINVANKTLKITDFGLSRQFKINKSVPTIRYIGTLNYIPPEIIEYKKYYPNKVDVWYCGIILYNIIYDCMLWNKACYETDDIYFVNELFFKRGKLYKDSFEYLGTNYQQEILQKLFLNIFRRDPVFRYDIHELVEMYDNLYCTLF